MKINKYRHVRLYGEKKIWPKTMPVVTDQGQQFQVVICEECGGDTFHIGIFDGKTRYQCVKCYPTTERIEH